MALLLLNYSSLHFSEVSRARHSSRKAKLHKQQRIYSVARRRKQNSRQQRQRARQAGRRGTKGNIPRSEGFEICFCLIVSEREKSRRRESTDRGSEKLRGPGGTRPAADGEKRAAIKGKGKKKKEIKTSSSPGCCLTTQRSGNTCLLAAERCKLKKVAAPQRGKYLA